MIWGEKRYVSLDYYYKKQYGQKIYKVALNGGFTCPNRDGTIGFNGCIFCSEGGSGDFASSVDLSITEQINTGIQNLRNKIKSGAFIAYFQAFTNTYAPVSYCEKLFREALNHPDIVGISIATRPDCLSKDMILMLHNINEEYAYKVSSFPEKPPIVTVELGLQTMHENSAKWMRRGYPLSVFEKSVHHLNTAKIPIVVHVIVGLPCETKKMLLETINYLNSLPIQAVKLAMLHILKNTDLGDAYLKKGFPLLSRDEYISTIVDCITHLRPDIVLQRITGDGPRSLLIAPLWTTDKRAVLNKVNSTLKQNNLYQGIYYQKENDSC